MKRLLMIVLGLGLIAPLAMADVWDELAQFTASEKSDATPVQIEKLIAQTPLEEMGQVEDRLIALVESTNSTQEAKWFSCRMLQRVGTEKCVPVLAGLLGDEIMTHYARLTLEFMKDSKAAGKALMDALNAAPDHIKIGIMGSLAVRGDEVAVKAIAKYTGSDNIALAKAALEALGRIGGKNAAAEIRKAKAKQAVGAEEMLARAEAIKDPGSVYRRGKSQSMTPIGKGYVTSDGKPGWKGEYFIGNQCEGEPVLVRHDEDIKFDWDKGSPDESIQPDNFTVRWTGAVTPPESRVYQLSASADDKITITVDGEQLTCASKGGFKWEAQAELKAATAHAVEVVFVELGGHAYVDVMWDCPSTEQQEIAIRRLAAVVPVAQQGGLLAAGETAGPDDAYKLMMEGRNPGIRTGAFIQLAAADPKRARNALVEVLKQVDGPLRAALLRAAMESGDAETQDLLVAGLKGAAPSDQLVLLGAIRGLELRIHEKDVIGLLAQPKGKVRDAAIYTLATIGGVDSFKPLYTAYREEASKAVTFAISQLPVPAVDAELMKTVAEDADVNRRLAAMTPLMLRNPDGAIELFNRLAAPEQPETIRKAAYKTLESIGNVESCSVFAKTVVQGGEWQKPAQMSLKRLCVSLDKGEDIWRGAFKPALDGAPNDEAREALLAILDGAACGGALSYLKQTAKDPANGLRPAAMRSLARWPQFDAGDAWLEVMAIEGATSEDIAAAQQGVVRVLSRKEIKADTDRKLKLAAKAVQQAPTLEFKQAVLGCYKDVSGRDKDRLKKIWKPLLNDTNIVDQVQALMD